MPVLIDNDESESDTVDYLATAEQLESEDELSQETIEKKKRHAKKVMQKYRSNVDKETPCLYQKGLRNYRELGFRPIKQLRWI